MALLLVANPMAHRWRSKQLTMALLLFAATTNAQADICGTACSTDVQCTDTRGICTYCRDGKCLANSVQCGGPAPANTTKPQLLVIGDSISLGWAPVLFGMEGMEGFEAQHDPINAGNAKKGYECVHDWVGSRTWDLVVFNFGLHSLDRPATAETETLANYTAELRAIATLLKARAKRVLWVTTTPVPLNVTQGPPRPSSRQRKRKRRTRRLLK